MVHGKKLAKEMLLPSVLEDDDAETESEKLQLGEQIEGQTEFNVRGPKDQCSSPDRNTKDRGERQDEEKVEEEEIEQEKRGGEERVSSDEDYDTDLEIEDKEEAYDPTGQTCYMEACKKYQVVPASYFLRHMQNSELSMMHRGLGPQGTKALAVPLVTNTSILRLNLRDNWMEEMGGAAIAEMLKENCYITEVDLSDNKLGDYGAKAIAGMLKENSTLVNLNLSGNHFTDKSAEYLGPALMTNTKLQHLDLSYNALGKSAGQNLGDSLSENTGLRSLSLAWNCIRGRGAVMLANGLGGNIYLRTVDLSFNGFSKEGAIALGQALKENSVLEELNVSNNRIPPEGAIRLAMGLRVNKTIKSLNMGKNPIQDAGCYGILKSVQENPDSAMETLDFGPNMATTSCVRSKGQMLYRYSVNLQHATRRFSESSDKGWFRSLFVHKVDARKDAHSNLLSKKETSNLYKIQFHNVKPECLEAYNSLEAEVQNRLHQDQDYPCEVVGSWNTWYGEQDQAVHLWRYRGGYPALTECLEKLNNNKEYLEFRKERAKMLISRQNQLLLEFSFWNEPFPRPGPNIYEMRTYHLKPGTMIEWGNHWARAIKYRQENSEAVGGFFSQIGDLYVVHHLWAYESLQSREETRNSAWLKEGWDVNVYYTVPLIRSMESRIMIPTKSSPLQ
ncbi:Protein NipSnap-like protein 1 [Larimichthys crocea]|uniref:Uncharacterized protein n=1 Tax=Larimichthys crocea TaxID=215358 RepID=A0ACD3Q9A1_LARCR|nr:Protein NipSnap-like protein 1 [Larimichthys crocea]